MRIPIARPSLGAEEIEAAARCLGSGWLTQGPEVAAFEREFAELVGAPYACAVSNCTTALHLALIAAGVRAGDEVITVSHSFIATANAIRYLGAMPVFVDIETDGFNIDIDGVEAAITPRTRAILCVHQLGMPCRIDDLVGLARARGLVLIEDAACAIGSEVRSDGVWEKIGKPHGDAACFSFHPRKVVTTGDGGMITTRHAEWDRRFRRLRQHAMTVPDTIRHASATVIVEHYEELGYNYRMTDLQAAVGRCQLRRLSGLIEERRALAARYLTRLSGMPGLHLPVEPEWARSNWQSFAVRLTDGLEQIVVMQDLLDRGIATRRGVMCAHRQPAYPPSTWTTAPASSAARTRPLARSEEAEDSGLLLPLFAGMTEAEQDQVVDALAEVIAARLPEQSVR
jgi:dTDP-4-amino-4,6-dideoxygalactose transaminase